MRITCDICGKPCRGQGTQGRGRNQRTATSAPTPRPTTPFIPNRHPGLVPHSVRSAHIHQSARNPRVRHAARPPTGTTASHPHHSRAQNADHLAQNTPYSLNFTEVVCTLGAHRTIGSTSKETQWMRIRSTPLRRTHAPPQVRTSLSAVDSLGVLSGASWSGSLPATTSPPRLSPRIPSHPSSSHLHGCSPCSTSIPTSSCLDQPPHGSGACHFCTSTHSTSPRFPTSTRARSHFRRFTRVHSISRRSRCAHTGHEEDDHRR